MPPEQRPIDYRVPIKSTWKDALGVPLTDRRITNRIRAGWYGRIAQLHLLARSANKAKRKVAREELKRFEGVMTKKPRVMRGGPIVDIGEFV